MSQNISESSKRSLGTETLYCACSLYVHKYYAGACFVPDQCISAQYATWTHEKGMVIGILGAGVLTNDR